MACGERWREGGEAGSGGGTREREREQGRRIGGKRDSRGRGWGGKWEGGRAKEGGEEIGRKGSRAEASIYEERGRGGSEERGGRENKGGGKRVEF